ncbi:Brp/Blh family beta-carotene 15,15'-dioxygenase [Halobacteria archaeon AArc-curdl1]|uniref:Probable beta-carotene 15,15'-dioxygenase n=1 Tax=Natronosalvus hydrolyticus TaxID=2979988 RepID=A0AAP2Z866_9EURY|nr:Brp/Blh family beta-carotene 15,15'-dioxygenase [Halobacteria archaeon AArc-curdl1]
MNARQRTRAWARRGAIATVLGGVLLSSLAVVLSLPTWIQFLPFGISVVVLGLPHGAVDHLVIPRARGEHPRWRSMLGVGILYLLVGGVYTLLWLLEPAVAFGAFILVTALHWGQGDVYALRVFEETTHLENGFNRAATLAVRGSIPMLVPLVAFPGEYERVATAIVGLVDPSAVTALEPAFTRTGRLVVAFGLGTLILATLVMGFVRTNGDRRPWFIDAAETIGLVGYFALVPPILAIGLYFCLWHSLRHILRTMLLDPVARGALEDGDSRRAWRRFARDATPLTLGGLAVIGLLALALPQAPGGLDETLGLYLIGIAVLTLPHVVVVALLDRIEGVWR